MITVRTSPQRGHMDHGWLDTYHTFSFGSYYDPKHMHFGALRVINEDVVAPARGFGRHPHDNMEILTWVLSGELAHADSLGTVRSLKPGEMQRMSAGSGIEHSEFNGSKTDPVHLLQIWIMPGEDDGKPAYDQKEFPIVERTNRLRLVASPDGADGSLSIRQNARVYVTNLEPGKSVSLDLAPKRRAWVQVARGSLSANGTALKQGDGAGVSDERTLTLTATEPAEALVFDLA